jgi:hypothetical protein
MQSGSELDRLVVLRDQRQVSILSFRVFGIRFAQPIDRRWHRLGKFIPLSQNLALPVRLTCNWTSGLVGLCPSGSDARNRAVQDFGGLHPSLLAVMLVVLGCPNQGSHSAAEQIGFSRRRPALRVLVFLVHFPSLGRPRAGNAWTRNTLSGHWDPNFVPFPFRHSLAGKTLKPRVPFTATLIPPLR